MFFGDFITTAAVSKSYLLHVIDLIAPSSSLLCHPAVIQLLIEQIRSFLASE